MSPASDGLPVHIPLPALSSAVTICHRNGAGAARSPRGCAAWKRTHQRATGAGSGSVGPSTATQVLSKHTGQSIETLRADSDRDRIFTARAALDYGLIDQILTDRTRLKY